MSVVYFQNVRCSFAHLTEPFVSQKFPGSPPMFSIDIINLDPNSSAVKDFLALYYSLASATWKEHATNVMQTIQNDKRSRCFGMGPEKVNETTFKPLDGYEQGFWINAKNKNRPQIIRPDGSAAQSDMEAVQLARKIYGGCRVNIAVRPWLRTSNKGVSCDLIAVQFAADDKAFGESAPDVSNLFGATQAPAAPAFAAAAPQMPAAPFGGAQAPAAPVFAAPTMPWAQ